LIHLSLLQVRNFVEHVNVSLPRRPNATVSFEFIAWLIISLATAKEKKKKKPDLFRFISRLNKEKNELADPFGYTVIIVSFLYYLVIESYLSAKRNFPVRRSLNVCSIVLTLES